MNHPEFMQELCRIIGKFSETLPGGETESCFCLTNPLSKHDVASNNWKNHTDVLAALREKLGVPEEVVKGTIVNPQNEDEHDEMISKKT